MKSSRKQHPDLDSWHSLSSVDGVFMDDSFSSITAERIFSALLRLNHSTKRRLKLVVKRIFPQLSFDVNEPQETI